MKGAEESTEEAAAVDRRKVRVEPGNTKNAANFREYYAAQLHEQLGVDGLEQMMAAFSTPLPVTVRIAGVSASESPAAEKMHRQLAEALVPEDAGGTDCLQEHLSRLKWYPNQAAWQLSVGKKELRSPRLAKFNKLLLREVSVGNLSRMEAVSMIPALVLDPRPGEIVLDLCAAPGSKTGQIMERVVTATKATGAVVANDPDLKRARLMINRTRTLATPSLVVTAMPGQNFPLMRHDNGEPLHFDRVLCDVPCSGDGTIRKSWASLAKWHTTHGIHLHVLQLQLLKRSLELVKLGGAVVYSTCSMNPLENEAVVAQVLLEAKGAVRVDAAALPGLTTRSGLKTWRVPDTNSNLLYESFDSVPESRGRPSRNRNCAKRGLTRSMFPPDDEGIAESLSRSMRIYPHDQDTGAFFVTLLTKVAEVPFKSRACQGGDSDGPSTQAEGSAQDAAAQPLATHAGESGVPDLEGDEWNLPADYVDRVTRVERQVKRLSKVDPYRPFTLNGEGLARWQAIADFYGVSSDFPHSQLLAHSDKMNIITFVTRESMKVILAAGSESNDVSIVSAGLRMLQYNSSGGLAECDYRLCLEALPRLMPYMTRRIVAVSPGVFEGFLETGRMSMDGVLILEQLAVGSFVVRMDSDPDPTLAVVAWRGRSSVSLWIGKEDAQSILERLRAG